MTQKRLVAYRNFSLATTVEILIGDPPNEKLHIDIDGGAVCIHFDAADFLPKHSGQVTLRFKTPHASDINALIHPA